MGKHSSDSDSEKRSKSSYKSRTKRRSSSSSSSESKSRRYKKKSERSKSRDRYSRSRRSRSSSSVAHKSKSRRRSKERTRYRDRYRRSKSRSKYRRSRSRSYIREYSGKARRRSSSSSSSLEAKHDSNVEDAKTEVKKSSPEMTKIDVKALNAINEDGFTQKSFSSSKSKKMMDNIVIDLRKQTIKVPEVEPVEPDSIFHHNLFLNEEARMEKWIKELYGYRQRALQQGLKSGEK